MPESTSVLRFIQAYSRFLNKLWEAGRRLSGRYDISGPQMGILRVIELMGPCSLGDIRNVTAGHLSALGQKVERLVAAGWIERGRNPADRRRLELRLTPKARRMLKREPHIGPSRAIHEMSGLSDREAERVADAMELVAAMMVGPGTRVASAREGEAT